MADADSTLEILIKLGVIGQADVKAANDLLAQSSKEAGKAADYLNPAFDNAAKSATAAEESSAKLGKQLRLLSLGARQAGADIPGLSVLLRGLFNPATAGFAVGLAAIEAYFSHLEKVQAKQLEWIQSLQKSNDLLREITSSGKSAGEQLLDINKALAEGQVKARGYTHELDQTAQMWKVYAEAAKDAEDAEQKSATDAATTLKARIDLLEKAGWISKQTADDARADAAFQAESAKVKAEHAAKEAQYQLLTNQQGAAIRRRDQLGTQKDAEGKLAKDESDLARNEAIISKMPAALAEMKNQAAAAWARKDFNEWGNIQRAMGVDSDLLDKAKASNPEKERRVAQDKDSIAAMASLDKTIEELNGQMNLLNQSIIDSDKSGKAHLDQSAQQHAIAQVADAGGLANAGNILSAGISAESAAQHGQRITTQQQHQIVLMQALITAVGGNGEKFTTVIQQLIAKHQTTDQILATALRDISNLKTLATRPST